MEKKTTIPLSELHEMTRLIPELYGMQSAISRKLRDKGLLSVTPLMVHRTLSETVKRSRFHDAIVQECVNTAAPYYDEYLKAKDRLKANALYLQGLA